MTKATNAIPGFAFIAKAISPVGLMIGRSFG